LTHTEFSTTIPNTAHLLAYSHNHHQYHRHYAHELESGG
jgi:hypothetical protein